MQPDGDAALLNYHIVGVTRDGIPEQDSRKSWEILWYPLMFRAALRKPESSDLTVH